MLTLIEMSKTSRKSISLIIFLFSFLMGGPPNSDMFTTAFQAKSNPKMDGDVLNDPAWESIPAITTFTQKSCYREDGSKGHVF